MQNSVQFQKIACGAICQAYVRTSESMFMIMNFPEKSTQIAFQAELISLEQIVPRESSEVGPGRRGVQKTTCEFDPQLAVSQDNRFWEGRCHKTDCSRLYFLL